MRVLFGGTLTDVNENDIALLKSNPKKFWKRVRKIELGFRKISNITEIEIPSCVKKLNEYSFWNCENLTKVTLSKNLRLIGDKAFKKCENLEEIIIPNGVKEIGDEAFVNCKSLRSITIPKSVKTIGKNVFAGCDNIKTVTFEDKDHFPEGYKEVVNEFNFNSIATEGKKVTFVRENESVKAMNYDWFDVDSIYESCPPSLIITYM